MFRSVNNKLSQMVYCRAILSYLTHFQFHIKNVCKPSQTKDLFLYANHRKNAKLRVQTALRNVMVRLSSNFINLNTRKTKAGNTVFSDCYINCFYCRVVYSCTYLRKSIYFLRLLNIVIMYLCVTINVRLGVQVGTGCRYRL